MPAETDELGPPYGEIWNLMAAGRIVPFLGAGASLAGRPENVPWSKTAEFFPNARELADFLAVPAVFPAAERNERDDLARVASYCAERIGRTRLREYLRVALNRHAEPGALHHFLASVQAPQVIVVTNYDTLLEKAFQAAGKPYDLVAYPTDLRAYANSLLWWEHGQDEPKIVQANQLDIDLQKVTVIYKMHGTMSPKNEKWDGYVITEEDYVEFLSRMTTRSAIPAIFLNHFGERSFLFLGYGLRDWNLRVVLRNLRDRLSYAPVADDEERLAMPSWAIDRRPPQIERFLWQRRGVQLFQLTIERFVEELRAARGTE